MKYFVFILLFTQFTFSQSPVTTIYLIRHADTSASELAKKKADALKNTDLSEAGKNILLVGHSNTIPDLANSLIGEKVYPAMAETEFGNLYIITINGDTVSHQLLKSL